MPIWTWSAVFFAVLSWYFYVPSTLYVYLVALCWTWPAFLFWDVRRMRQGMQVGIARRACHAVLALFWLGCVLRGWAPEAAAPAAPTNGKYFIASMLYNSEKIMPHYEREILRLTELLGCENVFVSILENDSRDHTPDRLYGLRVQLERRGVRANVTTTLLPHALRAMERIHRLAYLRNRAMAPLYEQVPDGLDGIPFSKVLWINDVLFDAPSLYRLLTTERGTYDQACALDYFWLGFYDTWVMRDRDGRTVRPLWPYFRRGDDRTSVSRRTSVPVNSCWNGATAFDARWFTTGPRVPAPYDAAQPVIASLPSPPWERDDHRDTPATLPLQFRPCEHCNVSEALLTSLDMHRLARPYRPRIFVNSDVVVAYNFPSWYLYRYMIQWYLLAPWRYVWQTWMERRLFSWIADLGNRRTECETLLQSMWVPASQQS